jgi:hypothetical protein
LDEYVDNCIPITKFRESIGDYMLLANMPREPKIELGDPLNTYYAADSSQTKGKESED